MVVSPDRHPERALYNVSVALRLVDRLLAELDLGAQPLGRDACHPGELTGRVAHALMLAETLGSDRAADADVPSSPTHDLLRRQLQNTLRGLLVDLERRGAHREAV